MNQRLNSFANRKFRARTQDRVAPDSVKARPRFVGVLANRAALAAAARMRRPPDFFELRLDALRDCLDEVENVIPRLRAPLILTARHPAEGGCSDLPVAERRKLLEHFLAHAAWIDFELRSAKILDSLGQEARRRKIGLIISEHDLHDTPTAAQLRAKLSAAISLGADLFKIATRTDTAAQLSRLLAFFQDEAARFPIAAMGLGKLGPESRRLLLHADSALNYASIGAPLAAGQITWTKLRRARRAYNI